MKKIQWKSLVPHLIAIAVFIIVALVYCKPALEGQVLKQGDVTQWKAMAQNSMVYKDKHGHFPLWTNGMFSGMPNFQITGIGSNPVSIMVVDSILQLELTKPMGFFFLACICFYFLTQVLRINPYVGLFGALAYAYATYNAIIIEVGHDTKMHAIGYLPAFLGSLILLYEKKYLWGTALTALFTGLLIAANHLQITYYGTLIAVIMSAGFGIRWIKEKQYKHLVLSAALVVGAALLGIGANAIALFSTYEYSHRTIRGGSELADGKNTTKTGLTKDYAMAYSFYKSEPLTMMFPRIYGGSSGNLEVPEEKSKSIEALQQMPQQLGQFMQQFLSFYWGGIESGTSGPPYIGAIICFLALLGFVLLDGKYKWWILTACVLTIMMSWGKYFEGFNSFLLSTLPMYNKFRAPSMILVVPTLLLCMMAVLTLDKVISDPNKELLFQKYKKGLLVVAGAFVLAILVYFSASFSGGVDKVLQEQVTSITNGIPDAGQKAAINDAMHSFLNGMHEDRKSLFLGDLLRTLLFSLVAAAAIFFYLKRRFNPLIVTVVIGIFAFIDLITIDTKYLNSTHYQDSGDYANSFNPRPVDQQILQDTGYYRIFDISQGVGNAFNGFATPSYFHKNIGGYHPAKLSIYQDLIEKQLYKFPNCMPVIDMLNTRYIIAQPQGSQLIVERNPGALGPCWFVKTIDYKKNAAEVMDALSNFNPRDTAILDESVKSPSLVANAATDSTAFIKLVYNDNDIIEYRSSSKSNEYAVFSEIYYDAGWVATIDGKESPIIRTNYALRGLEVPAGDHKIVFEFKPKSVANSQTAAIGSSVLIWLLLIGAVAGSLRKKKETA
jgi:hypothetical protein